jgi:plastocyanin
MKKIILFGAFALMISGYASATKITITNSGFTFSPDLVTINLGDTVVFQLASMHNSIEVNEATWNANGNAPIDGGWSLPLGGGQLTGLAAGTHFYVCGPHASLGMKGKVIVNGPSGIGDNELATKKFSIFPNPTNGKFSLQFNGPDGQSGSWTREDPYTAIEVFNILGNKVADLSDLIARSSGEVDLSYVPNGIYFIRIQDTKSSYTQKLIKR